MFNFINILLFLSLALLVTQEVAAQDDPTQPFNYQATSMATPDGKKMVLESIISVDGKYTVVISGNILKMFDYIGEYQLTAVNDQQVTLRSNKQDLKLALFKEDIVKASIPKNSKGE